MLPCTVSIAVLLSVTIILLSTTGDNAWHDILVLLYSDDAMTDRFLLSVISPSISKVSSCSNKSLLAISVDDIGIELILKLMSSLLLAVQVNSTVLPSTAAIDEGWTRNTVGVIGALQSQYTL